MTRLAIFCWATLLLGGTCQEIQPAANSFRCGPFDQAPACADGKSCCPDGHTCSADSALCIKTADIIPCDDKVGCKDGTTCCKTTQGLWSCCPLPEAVCCSDRQHCCPKDHTCNLAAQTCDAEWGSVPWSPREKERVVRCDDTHACADGTTCCKSAVGTWGCCPLPQAVCCLDGAHCCPVGYACDEQMSQCLQGPAAVPWYPKLAASAALPPRTLTAAVKPGRVRCDDRSQCQDGQTCCKISPDQWGCCPFANAVCCSDMQHCCEAGFQCTTSGQCIQNNDLPWFRFPSSGNKKQQMDVM